MEKIFDLRFLVPPTLFTGLFYFFCRHDVNHFIKHLHLSDGLLVAFLAGSVLAMGFIISSITHCFIINWRKREKNIYNIGEETKIWHKLRKEDDNKFFSDRFARRWEMIFANFNCCTALILALFFSSLVNGINLALNFYWLIYGIIFVLFFSWLISEGILTLLFSLLINAVNFVLFLYLFNVNEAILNLMTPMVILLIFIIFFRNGSQAMDDYEAVFDYVKNNRNNFPDKFTNWGDRLVKKP